jgi:thiol:disulfide interchange protein DsbC
MKRTFFTVLCLCMFTASAFAADKPAIPNNLNLPGTVIKNIEYNPALDLFEVAAADGNMFYLTKDQKHVILGNIFEVPSMKNITEEKKASVFKVDFGKLPLEKAVKLSDGPKKIAVFTSPSCPWCQKLHQELKKLDGVAVYAFIVPYGPQDKIKSIMCASNKQQAFEKAYSGAALSPIGNCSYQPAEIGDIGKKVFVNAYPTIITEDGRRISGFLPSDKLKDVIFNNATPIPALSQKMLQGQKTVMRGKK